MKLKPNFAPLKKIESTQPPEDDISLVLLDLPGQNEIRTFTSYEFHTDFMTPASSFSFEISDDIYSGLYDLLDQVQNGQKVALKINGRLSAVGYIDQINIYNSSNGGTTAQFRGRDALGPTLDCTVDPKFSFASLQTLKDVLKKLFTPFGFTKFEVNDTVNRQKLTGTEMRENLISVPEAKAKGMTDDQIKAKGVDPTITDTEKRIVDGFKPINVPVSSKFKPHRGEGVYDFGERLCKRFGCHLWCGLDGTTLYASSPTFDSQSLYRLIHENDQFKHINNLITHSQVSFDWHKQPSVIIVEGAGAGHSAHFVHQSMKVLMVNELLSENDDQIPAIKQLKKDYPEAVVIPRRSFLKKPDQIKPVTFAKPMFLYDDESKTLEHLKNYTRRIMAEHQSKFLTVEYTVNRHSQNKVTWTPNTLVEVEDHVNNIFGTLWIKERVFRKSASAGTTTTITCILPYTLELAPEGND